VGDKVSEEVEELQEVRRSDEVPLQKASKPRIVRFFHSSRLPGSEDFFKLPWKPEVLHIKLEGLQIPVKLGVTDWNSTCYNYLILAPPTKARFCKTFKKKIQKKFFLILTFKRESS